MTRQSLPSLTLGDSVQHHGDLLVVEEAPLQKLDEHAVGEAAGAQLERLGVLAPEQGDVLRAARKRERVAWLTLNGHRRFKLT